MKIVELNYVNTETWKLHIVVEDDATYEQIRVAAELAMEDGNFYENADSGDDNTLSFVGFQQVLDSGGEYLYTVDGDGNVWDYEDGDI